MLHSTTTTSPPQRKLPALSQNAYLRYFSFSALYLAQGIPEGLTFFAIPAWLAMNGKTPAEIGTFAGIVILPWSLKIIVAPLMDRFTFLPMGRRRPWVLFGQLGLILSIIAMALVKDPLNHLSTLIIAGFWVSFFGAFQDVAVDGMAIDIIPLNEQARANGIMWGSKTVGIAVSMAVGSWLINAYSFFVAVTTLSSVVVLIMMIPLCVNERPGERLLPWTKGAASAVAKKIQLDSFASVFKAFVKVFSLRSSLLIAAGCFFYGFTFHLTNTLLAVFTVQGLGWTDQLFSQTTATANLVSGLAGMVVGGILVDRFGKKQMITIYILLLITIIVGLSTLQSMWSSQVFITSFIVVFNLIYVFTAIANFSVCMQLCWKKISITQFTFFMTLSNMGYAAGAASLGFLKANLEWQYVILAVAVTAALFLTLIRLIRFEEHADGLANLDAVIQPGHEKHHSARVILKKKAVLHGGENAKAEEKETGSKEEKEIPEL